MAKKNGISLPPHPSLIRSLLVNFVWLTTLAAVFPTTVWAYTVNYSYDQAGRLIEANYGGGNSISYDYDNNGNRLQRRILSNTQLYELVVRISPAGTGNLNGDGIGCPADCTETYVEYRKH